MGVRRLGAGEITTGNYTNLWLGPTHGSPRLSWVAIALDRAAK